MAKQDKASKAPSTNYNWYIFSVVVGIIIAFLMFNDIIMAIMFGIPIGIMFGMTLGGKT